MSFTVWERVSESAALTARRSPRMKPLPLPEACGAIGDCFLKALRRAWALLWVGVRPRLLDRLSDLRRRVLPLLALLNRPVDAGDVSFFVPTEAPDRMRARWVCVDRVPAMALADENDELRRMGRVAGDWRWRPDARASVLNDRPTWASGGNGE